MGNTKGMGIFNAGTINLGLFPLIIDPFIKKYLLLSINGNLPDFTFPIF
jgi:hypothetical protein